MRNNNNAAIGDKLKTVIKEEGQNIKTLKDEAIDAINNYLNEANRIHSNDNIEFDVHCLLRAGTGENYGYHTSEAEALQNFIYELKRFFLNPKHSKAFFKSSSIPGENMADYLMKLKNFFRTLMEPDREAVIQRLDLIQYGHKCDMQTLRRLKIIYERNAMLAKSRREIWDQYIKELY